MALNVRASFRFDHTTAQLSYDLTEGYRFKAINFLSTCLRRSLMMCTLIVQVSSIYIQPQLLNNVVDHQNSPVQVDRVVAIFREQHHIEL